MQRPFFSLAILLEIIAVSLFLVSSAFSQTGVPAVDVPSSAVHGCGWLWQGASGQTIRQNFIEIARTIQTKSYLQRLTDSADLPWSVADNTVVAPAIMTTGYDAAYDFAMLEGQYYGLASTPVEIADFDQVEIDDDSICCPLSVTYDDDQNSCLDPGFNRWVNELNQVVSVRAWDEFETDDLVKRSLSSEQAQRTWQQIRVAMDRTIELGTMLWLNYSDTFAQAEIDALSDAQAQMAWKQLDVAATRTIEVLSIAVDSSWKPFALHHLVVDARSFSFDSFDWRKPAFPVASTITLSEGQQIAVLTQAAATLDQFGLFLQDAAQQLRYLAADRIVSKSKARRIARDVNH